MRKQEKNQSILQKRLIYERKRLGLDQKEVAKKIHTSKTSISNYETGYNIPSYDRLCDLANLYGVSVDYLYGKIDYRAEEEIEYFEDVDFMLSLFRQLLHYGLRQEDDHFILGKRALSKKLHQENMKKYNSIQLSADDLLALKKAIEKDVENRLDLLFDLFAKKDKKPPV